jgi:cytokinin riboside 5'-monophosphate phosphoribohydrolase
VNGHYRQAARELGEAIGAQGWRLVYGGTRIGLMGEVASAVRRCGGQVTGIVPGHIRERVRECEPAGSLVVTTDMRQRKALMEEGADAFVALPGGFGTLEEVMEILTLKQLGIHRKPVVFLNTQDFYRPLLRFFESLYSQGFARPEYAGLYRVVDSSAGAIVALREALAMGAAQGSSLPRDKWT